MALSADADRNYSEVGHENSLPVQASSLCYAGGALSIDSNGLAGPLDVADINFVGVCVEQADNSAGGGGAINVRVMIQGQVELAVTGLDNNDKTGDVVYANDDATFTLTSGGNMPVGRIAEIRDLASEIAYVAFQGLAARDHS